MLKDFLLRQVMRWKMKNVPEEKRNEIMALVQKDPELWKRIGEEVERRKKGGESEMKATMEVMKKHRSELQALKNR